MSYESRITDQELQKRRAPEKCSPQKYSIVYWRTCNTLIESTDTTYPRFSIGSYFKPILPTYSEAGRIRRLSAYCSSRCAVQPTTREQAKIGVNKSRGMPMT